MANGMVPGIMEYEFRDKSSPKLHPLLHLKLPDHLGKPLQDLCSHPFHELDAAHNQMPAAVDTCCGDI